MKQPSALRSLNAKCLFWCYASALGKAEWIFFYILLWKSVSVSSFLLFVTFLWFSQIRAFLFDAVQQQWFLEYGGVDLFKYSKYARARSVTLQQNMLVDVSLFLCLRHSAKVIRIYLNIKNWPKSHIQNLTSLILENVETSKNK